jgi:protein O-mannosyl-transferase
MNLDRRTVTVSAALFLGTLLVFSRAIGNDFVNYDDPIYATENPHVQAGLTPGAFRWALTTGAAAHWHPLTWISHMMDWSLFEDDPRGHHALNAVLVFLLFQRLTKEFWFSAFSAALFAWHPLRVESVAWIAERKDVLSGFFGLLALWAYVIYAQQRSAKWYWISLGAFAFGLLCKPMLVTLPLVMLLLDVWPLRRFHLFSTEDRHPNAGPARTHRVHPVSDPIPLPAVGLFPTIGSPASFGGGPAELTVICRLKRRWRRRSR